MSNVDKGRAMFTGTQQRDDEIPTPGTDRGRLMYAASRGDKDARAELAKKHHITTAEHADYDA